MSEDGAALSAAELAEGELTGPAWEAWRAANPEEAAEVEIARRVRALMRQLASAEIAVPAGFEARLLSRIREERTLLDLLDLGAAGLGRALVELINLLLGLLPAPTAQPAAQ